MPLDPEEAEILEAIKRVKATSIAEYLSLDTIRETVLDFHEGDSAATFEVLAMAAAFRELQVTTKEHGDSEAADGFSLKAEESWGRASRYEDSYDALRSIWCQD